MDCADSCPALPGLRAPVESMRKDTESAGHDDVCVRNALLKDTVAQSVGFDTLSGREWIGTMPFLKSGTSSGRGVGEPAREIYP